MKVLVSAAEGAEVDVPEDADVVMQLIATSARQGVAWAPAPAMVVDLLVAHHPVRWVGTVVPQPTVVEAMAAASVEAAMAILDLPGASPGGRLAHLELSAPHL